MNDIDKTLLRAAAGLVNDLSRQNRKIIELETIIEHMKVENERQHGALVKLRDWAKAYPVDIFPEPDMKEVRRLLESGGLTIDCVSASNFRWLLSRVTETAEEGLGT